MMMQDKLDGLTRLEKQTKDSGNEKRIQQHTKGKLTAAIMGAISAYLQIEQQSLLVTLKSQASAKSQSVEDFQTTGVNRNTKA
jgi:hypothetical protein